MTGANKWPKPTFWCGKKKLQFNAECSLEAIEVHFQAYDWTLPWIWKYAHEKYYYAEYVVISWYFCRNLVDQTSDGTNPKKSHYFQYSKQTPYNTYFNGNELS